MADKTKTFSTRIKSKRDTSANWESANPVLLNGEKIIVDTAAGEVREKIGDGVKTYSQLPFTDEKIRGMITEKADEVELERIKYYGDKDIVPSLESYFTVNSTGNTITGLTDTGKAQSGTLVIPYKINGVEITTLTGDADTLASFLHGSTNITKVIIPNSVTTIGDYAFMYCSSLKSINIPNSVTSIGNEAFENCSSLTSISIPDSVTSIGNGAFSNCSLLTSANISNSVTSIGNDAFHYCESLTSIKIPNSVTSIGNYAFQMCGSLTSIEIPNSVTSIGNYAFHIPSFGGIEDTQIPISGLKFYCEQGSYAETYAKSNNIPVVYTDVKDIATEVELERLNYYGDKDTVPSPESYFTVNTESPYEISGLSDEGRANIESGIIIPYSINGVKIRNIGNEAFKGFTAMGVIDYLVIPNSITEIGNYAFMNSPIYAVKMSSIMLIGNSAFEGCDFSSIELPNSINYIGERAFALCISLTSIKLPNYYGFNSILANTFYGCEALTKVEIPSNVTSIDSTAFVGCSHDLTIYCEQGSYADTYAKDNGIPVVYTNVQDIATETELERLKYYGDKDIIPAPESYFTVSGNTITGLTDIGKNNLSSDVIIPYKINGTLITSIGTGAFKNYEYIIDSITLPSSITAIEAEAFYGCTFPKVEVPSNVLTIGDSAFANCSSLYSVTILSYNILLDYSNTFSNCSTNLTIYCDQGSNAETYAKNNNIPVAYISMKGKVTNITVPTTGWTTATDSTGETYFTINITNSALTSTGYPLCDVVLPDDIAAARLQDEAYKCIGKITINDGSVTLCCFDEIPSVSFTMRIQIMYI